MTGTEFNSAFGDHDAAELLTDARNRCAPILDQAIETLATPLRLMAGYQLGWWDSSGKPCETRHGKFIRAALVFAAAKACGGGIVTAAPAAAAVELIHNFTIVHDDVIDEDTVRRGRPTVWSVWGKTDAILLGDALHAIAVQVLARARWRRGVILPAIEQLESAATELCRGQFEDCALETASDVDTDDYLRMAIGKTGALMGCACALGALCADADSATVSTLQCFGRELGLAFQFTDDLIGIWGDPAVTGKPAGTDIALRKRSLPVVAALRSCTSSAEELNLLYRSDALMTPDEIANATALIAAAGGRDYTARAAVDRTIAAVGLLPDKSKADDLITLASLAVERDR
ncbi:polyprenyl synthetase family protein [Nocardia colli]|uniref:polyprenyl synthetase family protein n=1 Tax=Nocardia colli TaxID=2545717 RepID=UPI0035D5B729